ncbi:Pr6Pr family membrane protein [Ornithinimicrobium sp. F0845]|uniref:Pr6Pr family membrane protein n=1 Tax=Ornithinimicrobium sp. F0845 TaxID=2926412 RepID=UPI001FF4A3D0|nr:Pr6Pr family membrane protein [Ornithinimicrobium sp. F0845]MCK0111235.1 Pr6Pr family membrane protein [Ornithinimicrobium sp. F0845]
MTLARAWHLLTLLTVSAALILQTVLVINGSAVLDETAVAPLGTRLFQMFCYFTIQSNLLVLVMAAGLVADPHRDGPVWRVVQTDAVLGITLTGVVHFVLLRPLLELTGWSAVADTLLHLVVPALVVLGWVLFGPRRRVDGRTARWSLAWPIAWLVVTLALGELRDWYPYPFLDVAEHGYAQVLLTSLGVTVLFLVLVTALRLAERTLPTAPRSRERSA